MPGAGRGAGAGSSPKDYVAVILAVGVSTAMNIVTIAVLIDALLDDGPGLSENATQILTGAFGGMLGVLGAYLGYRAGQTRPVEPPGSDGPGKPGR